ncbi:MAG: NAD(P)-binding domain-containing protein [Saprospiraceae bacterium]
MKIAIIGLGEAGSHFANDLVAMGLEVSGWDPNLQRELAPNVHFAANNSLAVKDADIIFSVNYTSESKAIAKEVLPHLKSGSVYCEMNTSAPSTKKEIESILQPANIHFVDLAIMAPVPPKGIKVPLLASGKGAKLLAKLFGPYSLNLSVLSEKTGDAAGRKLLRSIVYKGVAAVICEAMEAGEQFGLEDYIRTQINSIIGDNDTLIDRFVKGSRTHAKRRMHEMEAVVNMLEGENLSAFMSEGAVKNLNKYL